ncbi:MAG TPA: lysophospholipid acyltransferase family protein [Terriglobales bacterium]|jgi:1-acyl-sn-glycerol-3-phosphate acyltransferase|nr:lysophospholipid acyltransferase family protein [Terriglobales bacterium]
MNLFLSTQLRRAGRLLAFFTIAFSGLWRHRKLPPNATRAQCAAWLHEACLRGVRAFGVELSVEGTLPTRGLIVSNHLSYLDIAVYSAALPCVFVSKAEVEEWPIFGRYARWAGSVFVRRHDRGDAARANSSVRQSLNDGVPVVLFPEGTTSDGHRVLRFHSTMLQPAIDSSAPITPTAIRYELDDGDAAHEVCWWGDMKLVPHMWNLLGKKSIRARIMFGKPVIPADPVSKLAECGAGLAPDIVVGALCDRKDLSRLLHDKVVRLYAGLIDDEF